MTEKRILLTLVLIHQHPKLLLGMKKRGFGVGLYNGFGGKVHDGETIEEAAIRETKEEASIEPIALEKLGIVDFRFSEKAGEILEVHIFKAKEYKGEIAESEEMKPEWFFVDEIPFDKMWPDDIYWMPHFLKGRKFRGRFLFDKNNAILEKEVLEVVDF